MAFRPDHLPAGVRRLLIGTTEPVSAGRISDRADCSDNGAREALEQLVEMGIAERTGSGPATYRRNPSYFRWKRIEALAADHDPEELRTRLEELLEKDRELQDRYEVPDPESVTVPDGEDHAELHDRLADLAEWRTVRRDVSLLKRAVRRAEAENDDRVRV